MMGALSRRIGPYELMSVFDVETRGWRHRLSRLFKENRSDFIVYADWHSANMRPVNSEITKAKRAVQNHHNKHGGRQ